MKLINGSGEVVLRKNYPFGPLWSSTFLMLNPSNQFWVWRVNDPIAVFSAFNCVQTHFVSRFFHWEPRFTTVRVAFMEYFHYFQYFTKLFQKGKLGKFQLSNWNKMLRKRPFSLARLLHGRVVLSMFNHLHFPPSADVGMGNEGDWTDHHQSLRVSEHEP